jgi:NitT/TauT family transport system permease protein
MSADVLTPIVDSPPPTSHDSPGFVKAWGWVWPKALALGLVVAVWQIVVWSGWKPVYTFPGPTTVLPFLWDYMHTDIFWRAVATTLRRAILGFSAAVVVGTLVGVAVARVRVLRLAVGSLITGLQTMPSIAWFPLAILLFGLKEKAIFFVVILGAAPSVANGVISGIDNIPPQFLRLAKVLGARGFNLYRHIVLPAALPAYVQGMTQGWAFAWRSLMAGEILVIIAGRPALGSQLEFARNVNDATKLLALMIVILIVGMLADGVFSSFAAWVRRRRGLGLEG